jgi:hypothetical protein
VLVSNNTQGDHSILFQKWNWLKAHRGTFGRIAARQKTPVGAEFVRQVFWERRRSKQIRLALIRAGAPMTKRGALSAKAA